MIAPSILMTGITGLSKIFILFILIHKYIFAKSYIHTYKDIIPKKLIQIIMNILEFTQIKKKLYIFSLLPWFIS